MGFAAEFAILPQHSSWLLLPLVSAPGIMDLWYCSSIPLYCRCQFFFPSQALLSLTAASACFCRRHPRTGHEPLV